MSTESAAKAPSTSSAESAEKKDMKEDFNSAFDEFYKDVS